jgi:hypothetical protein
MPQRQGADWLQPGLAARGRCRLVGRIVTPEMGESLGTASPDSRGAADDVKALSHPFGGERADLLARATRG